MNVDYKIIGARIQDSRKRKGYTQEVLAEKLDVSVGYVSQVERGITKISLDLLAAVASILECDIADFIKGSSIKTEQYLSLELAEGFSKLSTRERHIILGLIKLLIENR